MKETFALVDERISEKCFSALKARGFFPIRLPKMPTLPAPIASHTDILCFKLGKKLFFSRSYFEAFSEALSPLSVKNISLTEVSQGVKYPLDAIFNGLIMNDRLFCKSDSFSKEILDEAKTLGFKTVHVNQGYPACTTLKISENAAITSDAGMEKALLGEGFSVLSIQSGGISLPPYEYGFIGGAASLFEDKIYFLGDISKHPESEKILSFIEENGKTAISLSDEPLADLGGIIFLNVSER